MATCLAAVSLLLLLVASATASAALHTVEGRVDIPALHQGTTHSEDVTVLLALHGGPELKAFARPDGLFAFHRVPAGTHMLDVVAMGFVYPQVRLDVTDAGDATGSIAEDSMQIIPSPLVLRPVAKAEYYEKRPPFSLQSLIMSPYGLMVGFMLFAMFIMPKLKVDPEEYKEYMASKDSDKDKALPAAQGTKQRRIAQ